MNTENQKPSFAEAILNRRMVICVFTGFASGLPLYILIQLVPAWLREGGVGLKEIGFFALIQFPYVWKFLWAPALDRYTLSKLGRRRSWMLVTQLGLLISVAFLGFNQPENQLSLIAGVCVLVALFSATQDIALDAYRRELLPELELGLGNSIHVTAYRVSGLIPGSLSLILADHFSWNLVFIVTALFMLIGIGMTLVISEANKEPAAPKSIKDAVVLPFKDFFSRNGMQTAITILLFMLLYKLGDSMATALSTPFYLDLGFTKTEIGVIAKNAALWPSIIGGLLGGVWMIKLGVNRSLWIFGVVQLVTILGFALLAEMGANKLLLAVVVALEYLGVGLGTAAFVAFIAKNTNPAYAATQFALLSALTALPRTFASATTGIIIEATGWTHFFLICALIAIPGMLMLFKIAPWNEKTETK